MKLASKLVRPPGKWRYRVAETGQTFVGSTMDELLRMLGKHCSIHHLPMPTEEQIEDQICFELGADAKDWCMDSSGMAPTIPPHSPDCAGLSLQSVKQATFTLVHSALRGSSVTQEEAERRASICVDCTQNREVPGCKGCAGGALRSLVTSIARNRATSMDDRLFTCCICGCLNKAKLWIDLDIIKKHTPASQWERFRSKAPNCWLLKN